MPSHAIGTELFVLDGWHQWAEPHFTVALRFIYSDAYVFTIPLVAIIRAREEPILTRVSHRGSPLTVAVAHVYIDYSETVDSCDESIRRGKSADGDRYSSWSVSCIHKRRVKQVAVLICSGMSRATVHTRITCIGHQATANGSPSSGGWETFKCC